MKEVIENKYLTKEYKIQQEDLQQLVETYMVNSYMHVE